MWKGFESCIFVWKRWKKKEKISYLSNAIWSSVLLIKNKWVAPTYFLLIFLPGLLWKPMIKFSEMQSQHGNGKGADTHCFSSINKGIRCLSKCLAFAPFSWLNVASLTCCQDASLLPVQQCSQITDTYITFCKLGNTIKSMSTPSLTAHSSCLQEPYSRQPDEEKVFGRWCWILQMQQILWSRTLS